MAMGQRIQVQMHYIIFCLLISPKNQTVVSLDLSISVSLLPQKKLASELFILKSHLTLKKFKMLEQKRHLQFFLVSN
jgi:hypothetical protein